MVGWEPKVQWWLVVPVVLEVLAKVVLRPLLVLVKLHVRHLQIAGGEPKWVCFAEQTFKYLCRAQFALPAANVKAVVVGRHHIALMGGALLYCVQVLAS